MFERFTERARQVVVLAQDEARALKHNYIGTEHILLGLLREEEGLAAQALEHLGVTADAVRQKLLKGEGEPPVGMMPMAAETKKCLELALREAISLGHSYIGTEHVLLGLVRSEESQGARLLNDLGVKADAVRNEIIRSLNVRAKSGQASKPHPVPHAAPRPAQERCVAQRVLFGTSYRCQALAGHDDTHYEIGADWRVEWWT